MIVYDHYLYPEKPAIDDEVVVLHSGFCSTEPHYSCGQDTRNYYLIHYVSKGKGTYTTEKASYALRENDGFLITPGSNIVHTADFSDPWDVCWVGFFGRKVEQLLKAAGLDADNLLFRYEDDDFLERCIKNIYHESRTTANIQTITGYFYLMIGKLIEKHLAMKNSLKEVTTFSHFDKAIIYINRNIRKKITIEHLCGNLRIDASQIYRIFMKNTHCSPMQYVTHLKIQKASEMLMKTDLSVKEIAEWMGFEYQSHFTKQFKSILNISPSDYRNQVRQEQKTQVDG
jgi:AraC-like DNA-binding protein